MNNEPLYSLNKHWRSELIALSFFVSFLGTYTTTQLCIQTNTTRRTNRAMLWLFLAAICFGGTGIWCMHFVGMLAVDIGLSMHYDTPLTIFTGVLAIFGTFLALLLNLTPPERPGVSLASSLWHSLHRISSYKSWIHLFFKRRIALPYEAIDEERGYNDDSEMSQPEERSSTIDSDSMYCELNLREALQSGDPRRQLTSVRETLVALWHGCTFRVLLSAWILGLDVFAMHFLGMKAMRFDGRIRYDTFFTIISFLEAWFASIVALIYMPVETDISRQVAFSLVAAIAVSGLHYIGMYAATFETSQAPPYEGTAINYNLTAVCAGTAIMTCFLSYAFLAHAVSDHKQKLQGYIQTRKELWKANAERRAFERSNKLKSDFIATASHELRTPLYSISGYSELLQTTKLDQEQAAYVQLIKSATKALSLITDSVLDFSKLENDNLESQAKPSKVEIKKLVTDCVRQCYMRKDYRSEDVTLLCIIDANVPDVCWIDEVYISRVIFNLCGNALKFTSEGYVIVRLSLGQNPQDMMLQCVDTGIGIPSESLQDIFKPFRQVDSTLQRKFHGTGLGLAISLNLMEKLGGTMGVKSSQEEEDPEKGTCFTCLFPNIAPNNDSPIPDSIESFRNPDAEAPSRRPIRNSLTFIRRQRRSHPVIASILSERFNLHTIPLDQVTQNSSTNRRILTEIECFKNKHLRTLFESQSQDKTWFVGFDEDAAAVLDLDLEDLWTRKNVVLLRRPFCITDAFFDQIDDLRSCRPAEPTELDNMSERLNPILPVTRDRARDEKSRSKARQVKFAMPTEGFQTIEAPQQVLQAAEAVASETSQSSSGSDQGLNPVEAPRPPDPCILLVEDNKINSKLGITLLKKCGLQAIAAENGQDAIDLVFADPNRFALILMDCQMPVMDGFTATRKIRAWEQARGSSKRIPIIALTANVSEAAKQECLEAGADKFLPKPLTMKSLRDEIGSRIGSPS